MYSSFSTSRADPQQSDTIDSDLYRKPIAHTKAISMGLVSNQTTKDPEKCSDLSDIILNSEQFWLKKVKETDEQSSIALLSSRLKMKKICQVVETQQSQLPQQSVVYGNSQLYLDSCMHPQNFSGLGLMTPHPASEFENLSAAQFHNCTHQKSNHSNLHDCIQSIQKPNSLHQSEKILVNLQDKVKMLEEMALLGYWCSLYLSNTQIGWQSTCVLLYKQVAQKLSFFISKDKISQQNTTMLKNLQSMLHELESTEKLPNSISSTIKSKINRNIFPQIMKESQIVVKNLMNNEFSSKTNQFMLFKVVKAVNAAGKVNGYQTTSFALLSENQQFCIQGLKKNLIVYKELAQEVKTKNF